MSALESNWQNVEWKNPFMEDLSRHLQDEYSTFMNKLEELHKRNESLFNELKLWPSYTEWRPATSFKDIQMKWGLQNMLTAFRERLIWQYPEHQEIIDIYYRLFMELEINPLTINKSQDILDILDKKTLES